MSVCIRGKTYSSIGLQHIVKQQLKTYRHTISGVARIWYEGARGRDAKGVEGMKWGGVSTAD